MVEASLIILHRNPFYLLSFFFFILLQILVKTAIAIRPTYRSDYSAPTICIHVSPSAPPAYLAVSSSEKIAKHSLILRKIGQPVRYTHDTTCIWIPLFICIRKFSILAVISEFQSSTKVAKKKIHSIDRLQFCFNLKFCVDLTKYWLINILIM